MDAPDVLVLGGGGVLGEVWMLGVLLGLEEATGIDTRDCSGYVGTSAGSIVASVIASGRSPRERLDRMSLLNAVNGGPPSERVPTAGPAVSAALLGGAVRAGRTAAGLAMPLALWATAPGGALIRRAALSRVPRGRESLSALGDAVDRSGVTFDGRLRISAVAMETGGRVMFGAPGAPETTVATAVRASCAIPGYFEPVRVGDRTYVDGGAWSPTNMDRAPTERGTRVLCLNPTGALRPRRGSVLGAFGPVSRAAATAEAMALERRGAKVKLVAPDAGAARAMGSNFMAYGPREAVAQAAVEQGRRLGEE